MHLRRHSFAAAVAVASAGLAFASGASFKGKQAPDLGQLTWVQGQEVEGLKALRGKVVMLEFFGTG